MKPIKFNRFAVFLFCIGDHIPISVLVNSIYGIKIDLKITGYSICSAFRTEPYFALGEFYHVIRPGSFCARESGKNAKQ